jgi:hypothetical protein
MVPRLGQTSWERDLQAPRLGGGHVKGGLRDGPGGVGGDLLLQPHDAQD